VRIVGLLLTNHSEFHVVSCGAMQAVIVSGPVCSCVELGNIRDVYHDSVTAIIRKLSRNAADAVPISRLMTAYCAS